MVALVWYTLLSLQVAVLWLCLQRVGCGWMGCDIWLVSLLREVLILL